MDVFLADDGYPAILLFKYFGKTIWKIACTCEILTRVSIYACEAQSARSLSGSLSHLFLIPRQRQCGFGMLSFLERLVMASGRSDSSHVTKGLGDAGSLCVASASSPNFSSEICLLGP